MSSRLLAGCGQALVLLAGLLLPGRSALAQLDEELIRAFSPSVVRVLVSGRVEDRSCSKVGTGFFIDDLGHILTAGHNVLPCDEGGLGHVSWDEPPTVTVEFLAGQPGAPTIARARAVSIYADEQTDLGLMRASIDRPRSLPLAPVGTLQPGQSVSLMVFEQGQAGPSSRPVMVESLFNPSEHHDGLVDISGPDVEQSASGGPLFDMRGRVAGVLTKGKRQVGEAVVPISFAAPLFQMAGVSYPSHEVREVIEELKRDLVAWEIRYEPSSGNLVVDYKKRLKSGASPVRFAAELEVHTRTGAFGGSDVFAFDHTKSVSRTPLVSKRGTVAFGGIGREIDEQITIRNEGAGAEGRAKLEEKKFAYVTIEVEFADGLKIKPVRDQRVEFDQ